MVTATTSASGLVQDMMYAPKKGIEEEFELGAMTQSDRREVRPRP